MSRQSLDAMWKAHRSEPFPQDARGRTVQGIDLVLLDSLTAVCIDSLAKGEQVDASKIELLRDLVEQIGVVLPHLSDGEQSYFAHLEVIASAALNARGVASSAEVFGRACRLTSSCSGRS